MISAAIAFKYHHEYDDLIWKNLITLVDYTRIDFIKSVIKVYHYLSNKAFLENVSTIVAFKKSKSTDRCK